MSHQDFFAWMAFAFLALIVIVGCTKAYCKRKQGQFPCILCKEKVSGETWAQHRIDCACEHEWFIEALPKSLVS